MEESFEPGAETPEDGLIPAADHPIRLPVFEGPLDLLLYLIRKNEIDIHDIPIGVVTKQYLEVLRGYETMDLDVAGEFFVMAATLMYIKSRMLLPPEKAPADAVQDDDGIDEEENLDPRWQLVRQLIQYKRIKESAGHLSALIEARQGFVSRLVPPPADNEEERPVANADRIEIWNTFNNILRRLSEKAMPGEIHAETITITTRMEDILARLGAEKSFTFTSLLPERPTVPFLVATFLACLELARLGKLLLAQTENFEDILCNERPAGESLPIPDDQLRSEFDKSPEDDEDAGKEEVVEPEFDHEHGGDNGDAFSEDEDVDSPVDEDDFDEDDFDDDIEEDDIGEESDDESGEDSLKEKTGE